MERAERSLLLPDLDATQALGRRIAGRLAPGDVVLLAGDLGVGKSELARAVIRTLAGADVAVPSPTFTLVQGYELPRLEVSHADLYRLGDPGEIQELGLEETWLRGALLVEWPERASWLWPAERLTIRIEPVPKAVRGHGGRGWRARDGGPVPCPGSPATTVPARPARGRVRAGRRCGRSYPSPA